MNCKDYKQWIFEDEELLSEEQKEKLITHLNLCKDCKEIYQKHTTDNMYIKQLSKIEPELTYPGRLTADIMNQIQTNENRNTLKSILMKLLDIIFSYRVRTVVYTIVILFAALFAYQQYFIINKLERIESKVATQQIVNEKQNINIPVRNQKILKELTSETSSESITLNKKDVDRLLKSYKNLKTDHDNLVELLNENMQILEKKLSKEDIRKLQELLSTDTKENKTINL